MVYELIRNGRARRFRGSDSDAVVMRIVFREPHELWIRPPASSRDQFVRLLDNGTSEPVDLADLVSEASLWQEISRLQPGEATEIYFVSLAGSAAGYHMLARVS